MSRSAVIKAIQELADLHKSGILTDEEFQTEKQHLLKRLREEPLEDTGPQSDTFESNPYKEPTVLPPQDLSKTIDVDRFVPPTQQTNHTLVETFSFSEAQALAKSQEIQKTSTPHTFEEPAFQIDQTMESETISAPLSMEDLRHIMATPPPGSIPQPTPTPPPTQDPLIPMSAPTPPPSPALTPPPSTQSYVQTKVPTTPPPSSRNCAVHKAPEELTREDLPQQSWNQPTPLPNSSIVRREKKKSIKPANKFVHTMDFDALPDDTDPKN